MCGGEACGQDARAPRGEAAGDAGGTRALPGVRRARDVCAEICQARWRLKKATIRCRASRADGSW